MGRWLLLGMVALGGGAIVTVLVAVALVGPPERSAGRSAESKRPEAPESRPVGSASASPGQTAASGSVSGRSRTCQAISGQTPDDLEHVKAFCAEGIPRGVVVGAAAMDLLLWVKVNQAMAEQMRADPVRAEQLVLVWMQGWKQITEAEAVVVTVEWRDVEIATGETTLLSGDRVTMH